MKLNNAVPCKFVCRRFKVVLSLFQASEPCQTPLLNVEGLAVVVFILSEYFENLSELQRLCGRHLFKLEKVSFASSHSRMTVAKLFYFMNIHNL